MINVDFGWQTSVVAAAIFGLSHAAKILLPMAAAALGGWNVLRRMAWFVAVVTSVAAALSSLLQSDAQRLHASRTAADTANAARFDEARTRQQLAAITEALSVEARQTKRKQISIMHSAPRMLLRRSPAATIPHRRHNQPRALHRDGHYSGAIGQSQRRCGNAAAQGQRGYQ
jgi:hypothetical protein